MSKVIGMTENELFDRLGLKGDDRSFEGVEGQHLLNKNAVKLQQGRRALLIAALSKLCSALEWSDVEFLDDADQDSAEQALIEAQGLLIEEKL